MNWIDAHCHLADPRLAEGLDGVIERSRAAGVQAWVQGGVDPGDWERQLALRGKYGEGIVLAFGLHPWWVAKADEPEIERGLSRLEEWLPRAQALGELGLDLAPRHCPAESLPLQRLAFEGQLAIAKRKGKPLILHIVKAHGEALECLKRYGPFPAGGLVHSFSGSREVARGYLDLGFLISIGSGITREGFQTFKKSVIYLPLDKIVIETDSPDQTPVLPGVAPEDLNEPANLLGIAEVVAGLRKVGRDEILASSATNLKRLFGKGL